MFNDFAVYSELAEKKVIKSLKIHKRITRKAEKQDNHGRVGLDKYLSDVRTYRFPMRRTRSLEKNTSSFVHSYVKLLTCFGFFSRWTPLNWKTYGGNLVKLFLLG